MHLTQADKKIYQRPHIYPTVSIMFLLLTMWHKQLGYINLIALFKYFIESGILFVDDAKNYVCDSC